MLKKAMLFNCFYRFFALFVAKMPRITELCRFYSDNFQHQILRTAKFSTSFNRHNTKPNKNKHAFSASTEKCIFLFFEKL